MTYDAAHSWKCCIYIIRLSITLTLFISVSAKSRTSTLQRRSSAFFYLRNIRHRYCQFYVYLKNIYICSSFKSCVVLFIFALCMWSSKCVYHVNYWGERVSEVMSQLEMQCFQRVHQRCGPHSVQTSLPSHSHFVAFVFNTYKLFLLFKLLYSILLKEIYYNKNIYKLKEILCIF